MSLPIIKRFWPKIVPPKRGLKIHVFWGLGGENVLSRSWDLPRKSVPTGTRHLTQKRRRYFQKCVLQSCARNHKQKNIKKTFEHDISPLCRGAPVGPIVLIFACWVAPTTNHAYQILSRSHQGLRSYGGPKSGVSYSFWTALTTVLRTTVLHCDYLLKTQYLRDLLVYFHWLQNSWLWSSDRESPFCVKFCFVPVCLELWSLAFEAWLLLNLYWMSSANFKPKRTAAASRGFLSTARLSC